MLLAIITVVAIFAIALGAWIKDLVVWILDTIIWVVWTYIAINEFIAAGFNNTYFPTAVGLVGAGFVLLGIYKDIAVTMDILRKRRGPAPMTYEEEKEANRQKIYNITRYH